MMKYFLSPFLLLLIALLSTCVCADEPVQAPQKIRVAIYEDKGVGVNAPRFPPLFNSDPTIEWKHVSCQEIRDGVLDNYDILLVPGGVSDMMGDALERSGVNKIKEFLKSGKCYLGFCAGAYVPIKQYFFNAQTVTRSWYRGSTLLKVEMSDLGLAVFGDKYKGIFELKYGNGPVVNINVNERMTPVEILMWFRSEITTSNAAPHIQINTPCMLLSTYGRGTMLISSVHPEATPEYNVLVLAMVHHLERCLRHGDELVRSEELGVRSDAKRSSEINESQEFTQSCGSTTTPHSSLLTPHLKSGSTNLASPLRDSVVAYMLSMASVEWTPETDIPWYTTPELKVLPETKDTDKPDIYFAKPEKEPVFIYKAGQMYKGIPYSKIGRYTNLEWFESFLRNKDGKQVYVGAVNPQQYCGSDSSSSCCYAWRHVLPKFPILKNEDLEPGAVCVINPQTGLPEPLILKVGNYKMTKYSASKTVTHDNGKDVMFACYDQLLPGDAIVKHPDGAVAMVYRVDKENKKIYVIQQSALNDQNQLYSGNSSWRVDYEYSYDKLFEDGFLPVTPNGGNK